MTDVLTLAIANILNLLWWVIAIGVGVSILLVVGLVAVYILKLYFRCHDDE